MHLRLKKPEIPTLKISIFAKIILKMKVLIISYYWPPAGGPGVQRWLKFAKYLPENGIEPIVYTPKNPSYPIVDYDLLNEVPTNATVINQSILEPYAWAYRFSKDQSKTISSGIIADESQQTWKEKFMLWIRGNLFIPDARVLWVKPSVRFLTRYIQENQIETIITTGPPHSVHLIGLALKKKLKVQWIADFRDPWTTIGYHKALKLSNYARLRHEYLEKKVLTKASKIIVTSPTTQKEFLLKTEKPIRVITNGYDNQPFIPMQLDKDFSLAHTGSFLSNRNPLILWKCLKELCAEFPEFKTDLRIKLAGKVSDKILETLESFGLFDNLENVGYVSHNQVLSIQKNAQILLLIEIDSIETKGIIPGKLFEYMVSERPIIALGPEDSDIQEIIQKTNTGVFFEYDQKEELKQHILNSYHLYKNHQLKSNAVGLQPYSRKKLTQKLADFIKS